MRIRRGPAAVTGDKGPRGEKLEAIAATALDRGGKVPGPRMIRKPEDLLGRYGRKTLKNEPKYPAP